MKKTLSLEQIMLQPRRQGIVYSVVVGGLAVAIVSLLVYLFAISSSRAVPLLFYLLGFGVALTLLLRLFLSLNSWERNW